MHWRADQVAAGAGFEKAQIRQICFRSKVLTHAQTSQFEAGRYVAKVRRLSQARLLR